MKSSDQDNPIRIAKPKWLKRRLPSGPGYEKMRNLLKKNGLTTVCQEAQCPNQFECYAKGTATFMILGDKCTRNCTFCAVAHGPIGFPDRDEPLRVAEAVAKMGLKYAVLTSVTRDDLRDGGASFFAETIREVRKKSPATLIEVLIPDLQGDWAALHSLLQAQPDVLNHNMETVARLYSQVRPQAVYKRSLELLGQVKKIDPQMVTKSGIMLGLGERRDELPAVMNDLLAVHCDILTLGQYLQPSRQHHQVIEFITPAEFAELGDIAMEKGFAGVASGPAVRSSYEAEKLYDQAMHRLRKGLR